MTDTPFWLELRDLPRLFCIHPTPRQLAILLEFVADRVEHRGEKQLDLDPGETADWLRAEAKVAMEAGRGGAKRRSAIAVDP